MNLNEYQRSRSFIDLCARSLRFNIFKILFLRNSQADWCQISWDGGTKVCSNGPGLMTKLAAMPIYGKNIKKSSSLEPKGRWPWKSGTRVQPSMLKWVSGLTLAYFTVRSNFIPYACVWEEGKTMDFSATIVVFDIKVGRCGQLNEYMKLYEYQRSRSFTDLGPNISDSIF